MGLGEVSAVGFEMGIMLEVILMLMFSVMRVLIFM